MTTPVDSRVRSETIKKEMETLRTTIEKKREDLEQLSKASPAGKARKAYERGDSIFQTDFDLQQVKALVVPMLAATNAVKTIDPSAVLNSISSEGWRLVNAGFVFKELGQESRDKFMASGQQVATKGTVIGYYIFWRDPDLKVETELDRRSAELEKLKQRRAHHAERLAHEEARRAEEAAAGVPRLEPFNEFK